MNQINILFVAIDGTLTTTKSGKPFKQSPDDIKPIHGAKKAIEHFANRGYKIFGVSNQGGCDTIDKTTGKPFKSVGDAILEMQNTIKLFPEISFIHICHKMDGSNFLRIWCDGYYNGVLCSPNIYTTWKFRKPDTGMVDSFLHVLADENEINQIKKNSLFVGDRDEDGQCANNAGIPFMDAEMWLFKYGNF